MFFKDNLIGGICSVGAHRVCYANRPDIEGYNPSKPIKVLSFYDINSLYSFCMMKALPLKQFRWLSSAEITKLYNDIITHSAHNDWNEAFYRQEVCPVTGNMLNFQ